MDKMRVPFVDLSRFFAKHKTRILELTEEVGESGNYILGDIVEDFENDFAEYCGVNFAISVGNGTDAIALSLRALRIGVGDEVIIPANSFIATAGAVIEAGAKPICVDVDQDQNISLNAIQNSLSEKTRAIIVVHLNGNPANIQNIKNVFKGSKIRIIEDAAQSIGATLNGELTGSFGDCGCFSLHPLKNFHMFGDAGMITTNSGDLAKELKILRNHGLIDRDRCEVFSRNSRLDTLQASYGKYLLPYLDDWTDRVIKIAEYYNQNFEGLFYIPRTRDNVKSVYHNYVIQTPLRGELSNFLQLHGIDTKIHYPIPICEQPAWQNCSLPTADIPMVQRHKEEILSLPIYAELTDLEIEYVVDNVKAFYRNTIKVRKAI